MKSSAYLTLLFFLFANFCFSQEKGSWKLDLEFGNDFFLYGDNAFINHNNLVNNSPGDGDFFFYGSKISGKRLNYSFSVDIVKEIKQKLDLGFGLRYSNRDNIGFYAICDQGDFLNLDFLEFSVSLKNYIVGRHKILSPYLLYSVYGNANQNDQFLEDINQFLIGAKIGAGSILSVSNKCDFYLDFSFRHDTTPFSKFASYRFKGFAFAFGISYHLRKRINNE